MYSLLFCFIFSRNIVQNLGNGDGIVKRDTGDGGTTASEISSLRSSLEIMMENVNHLVTKQQVQYDVIDSQCFKKKK